VVQGGTDAHVELVLSESGAPNLEAVQRGLAELEAFLANPDIAIVRLRARFATRVDFELWVPDLPAHGYRTLGVRPAGEERPRPASDDAGRIQNEWISVESAPDGTITLTDLRNGHVLPGLLGFRNQADRGDSYNFCPLEGEDPIEKFEGPVRVRREAGPCAQILEIEQSLRVPPRLSHDRTRREDGTVELPVRVRVRVVPGVPRVDVELDLVNTAEDHRLQVLFPLGGPADEAWYDGHLEIVRRATGITAADADWVEAPVDEQPMRNFVGARAGDDPEGPGLLVAAHGLREASVSPEGTIAVTLLRSFGWLSRDDLANRVGPAGPIVPTPGGQCLGTHRYGLSLIPFSGDLLKAVQLADAFQTQPRGIGTSLHGGPIPPTAAMLRTEPAAFRLSAVHPAQDESSVVVRGVYLGTEPGEVRIQPLVPPAAVERVRLDGTPLGAVSPSAEGTIRIEARPNEIVSVQLRYPTLS
jgi:hypothetical protein